MELKTVFGSTFRIPAVSRMMALRVGSKFAHPLREPKPRAMTQTTAYHAPPKNRRQSVLEEGFGVGIKSVDATRFRSCYYDITLNLPNSLPRGGNCQSIVCYWLLVGCQFAIIPSMVKHSCPHTILIFRMSRRMPDHATRRCSFQSVGVTLSQSVAIVLCTLVILFETAFGFKCSLSPGQLWRNRTQCSLFKEPPCSSASSTGTLCRD